MKSLKLLPNLKPAFALMTLVPATASGALYFPPTNPGNEPAWSSIIAQGPLTVITDPLSLNPENSAGSGIVNSSESSWSSASISLLHNPVNTYPGDSATVVEGSHVEFASYPGNVVVLAPGFGGATSFAALGFNFEKTSAYAVNIYLRTAGNDDLIAAPGMVSFASGFWGYIAENPDEYLKEIHFVQSNWPGPDVPEFRISDIRVSSVPEPSALFLTALSVPFILRRRSRN